MSGEQSRNLQREQQIREQNRTERQREMQARVNARKQAWGEHSLTDNIARRLDVDTDPALWKGRRWWVEAPWLRPLLIALIAAMTLLTFLTVMGGNFFFGIASGYGLLTAVAAYLHVRRFGG